MIFTNGFKSARINISTEAMLSKKNNRNEFFDSAWFKSKRELNEIIGNLSTFYTALLQQMFLSLCLSLPLCFSVFMIKKLLIRSVATAPIITWNSFYWSETTNQLTMLARSVIQFKTKVNKLNLSHFRIWWSYNLKWVIPQIKLGCVIKYWFSCLENITHFHQTHFWSEIIFRLSLTDAFIQCNYSLQASLQACIKA